MKYNATSIGLPVSGWQNCPVPSAIAAAPARWSAAASSTLRPSDPLARALNWSTMAGSLSSGLFYSVSALFFTRVIGLAPTTVGLGLVVAGAVGVAGSFGAGYLADRVGAERVLLAATAAQGVALLAYGIATSAVAFVLTACCAVGFREVQGTARSALLARCFPGADRVGVRARLRVVTNVFIGLGTCLAAGALLHDTAGAYRATLAAVGVLVLLSCLPLLGLPALVRGRCGDTPAVTLAQAPGGRSPLRDGRYLAVAGLNAVLAMHFGLQTVGVPLWVAGGTAAPPVTVSVLLVLNTVLVALFQVRAARGTHDIPTAGRAVALAGAMLAVACALYAAAGLGGVVVAVGVLVLAALAHTAGEMWGEAGSWGLAFELADERRAGAYQGVSQTGYALGAMAAPLVVTATAVEHGAAGWAVLGATFLVAGLLTLAIARRAADPVER
ncbi:MFS transporter [Blastococcus sp. SYSU DS0828]